MIGEFFMNLREIKALSTDELSNVLKKNKVLNRWVANDYKKLMDYYGLKLTDEEIDSKVLLHFKSILFVFEGKCWVDEDFKLCNRDGTEFNWGLLDIIQFI
jgi:hypothetical protein